MRRAVPVERFEGIDAQSGLSTAYAAERSKRRDTITAALALAHLRPLHFQDWTIAAAAGFASGALSLLFKLRGRDIRSTQR